MLAVILYIETLLCLLGPLRIISSNIAYDHITFGPPIIYFTEESVIECPNVVYCISQTVLPIANVFTNNADY
jgi:hypothetical protein